MDRRNGYTDLISGFEDLKVKRKATVEGIEADTIEIKSIEKRIRALKRQWKDVQKALTKDIAERAKLDATLSEIDVAGLSSEAMMLKIQQASMSVEEYAANLRKDLEDEVRNSEARANEEHAQQAKAIDDAVRKATKDVAAGPGDTQRLPVISGTPRVDRSSEAVTITNSKCKIEDEDGKVRTLAIRCYRSTAADLVAPHMAKAKVSPACLVYFHGDGIVTGSLDTHDWLCRTLAGSAGVVVASVAYRQPPEHRFPAAFDDAWAALEYIADGGIAKGKPPARLAVAGDSAGGGLAAACCLRARDAAEAPKIALQILFYPWLDLRPDSPAVKSELCDGRFGVRREALDWLVKAYAPRTAKESEIAKNESKPKDESERTQGEEAEEDDEEDPPMDEEEAEAREKAKKAEEEAKAALEETEKWLWASDPRASPLLMETAEGLPRTFLAYCADDPLSIDAIKFAGRLRSECSDPKIVHTMRMKGPRHGFAKFADKPEAQTVLTAAAAFLSAAFYAPLPSAAQVESGRGSVG